MNPSKQGVRGTTVAEHTPDSTRKHPVVVHSTPHDPAKASEETIRRAQVLIHELANLVDGSLRLIDLARQSIVEAQQHHADPAHALRHLEGAHAAMSHIAALVRSAYLPARRDAGIGADPPPPSSLASAITSAVDVLAARARSRGIEINLELDATTRAVPADEVYAVVSNAVRNSIEAIGQNGRIDVCARIDDGHVLLEVLDNGVGPPADPPRAFELGYSTKPGSSGIGLALAGEVITELRGIIELLPRSLSNPERPGAILRARYPIPAPHPLPFRE